MNSLLCCLIVALATLAIAGCASLSDHFEPSDSDGNSSYQTAD